MAELIEKSKRILEAVDAFHARPDAMNRSALRQLIMAELESAGMAAIRELENIVKAKRHDRSVFDDDTAFADWAQSRARHTLKECDPPHDRRTLEPWKATGMNEQGHADKMVRYCPECGLIGPVKRPAATCCPDSFGMSVRRWQAEKLERMLERLRTRGVSACQKPEGENHG